MTGKFQEEVTSGVFETSLPDMVAWNGMGSVRTLAFRNECD